MGDKDSKSRKKKKLGSYPSFSVIFSITLSLFVIGLFGLLILHANRLSEIVRENVEIQVYLNKDISQNQKIQVFKTLSSKEYVAKQNDEVQISFISKEEAEKQFIEDTGEDFKEFLGENPLRDAYIVKIAPEQQQTANLKTIKKELEKLSGVFEVVYVENLVDSINENMTKIALFLLGFAVILLLVVIILINNTIKLALFSQRFLIRSMQLVGATSGFIQRPFLMRSIFNGILAGILSSVLLYSLMNFANSKIQDLETLQEIDKILILFMSLLVIGGVIGLLSTYRSVRKYLKMSLDELY
ncbi:cell division protein FtsX [Fulvivirga lutea]|uniref:Cell division protein FtsX n=1 Tax=Fulvivirga lutea TaxID=2810512 RepID=A0A974WEH0_9BACT|nr:permease-like cell division protein FtsX [Fulvivirga lutea]QSE96853.1 ABC transporter permease [Fulvivirga lutea]